MTRKEFRAKFSLVGPMKQWRTSRTTFRKGNGGWQAVDTYTLTDGSRWVGIIDRLPRGRDIYLPVP
jgi:hypothetical protein